MIQLRVFMDLPESSDPDAGCGNDVRNTGLVRGLYVLALASFELCNKPRPLSECGCPA